MKNTVSKLLNAIKGSRFGFLFYFVSTILVLSLALRIAFLVWSFPEIDLGGMTLPYIFGVGLLYDLSYAAYASLFFVPLLLVLPNRIYNSLLFKGVAFLGLVAATFFVFFTAVGEVLFWEEFGVRFNFISVDYLVYSQEVVDNIVESYPIGWIFAGIALFAAATVYLGRNYLLATLRTQESFARRAVWSLGVVLAAFAAYGFVGQGARSLSDNNFSNELASNGPYQFVAAFRNNELDYRTFYALGADEELSPQLKVAVGKNENEDGLYDLKREVSSGEGIAGPKQNVILISVESLSGSFLGRFGNTEGLTPFLDELAEQSLFFTRHYATGTRTTRGLEAITLSVPPTPGRSLVKRPDNGSCYSLGKVFGDSGYDVKFVYGGHGFFDNMNAFFSGNGYGIVDQGDFAEEEVEFANAWGVCDGDLYEKTIELADAEFAARKPFMFHVMTTSNHRPYTYPEGKVEIPSGTGREGAVQYTDYALRGLIETVREKPWFANTVFVIVADHCASSAGKVGLPVEKYHIPLMVYAPGRIAAREVDALCSQIDIAPTLLGLLGLEYESHFFGNDVLSPDFADRALIGNYQKLGYLDGERLAILSPLQGIEVQEIGASNEESTLRTANVGEAIVEDAMKYYQGADYVLRERLNRYR